MIRMATAADAEAAGRIYDPIVERTAISFELDPPGPAEMERRIGEILPFAPWLVDEHGGEVRGYAYASKHRDRAAYQWSVDVTVYVDPRHRREGLGKGLYTKLFRLLRLQGFEGNGAFRIKTIGLTPNGLTVAGATEEDRAILKAWRDALSMRFGYRHPDHDTYVFHITFAYQIRRLADERVSAWQGLFDDCLSFLAREAPVIELRQPAFCSFKDMKHFEELLVLG